MNNQFITQQSLEELDVDLAGEDIEALLEYLNDTLQERVSTIITASLDEEKLKTLILLQESASDEELGAWLEKNVPTMPQILQEQSDLLMTEIIEDDEEAE